MSDDHRIDATSIAQAAALWASQYGCAPLSGAHAASLAQAALGVTQAAARAAQTLDWLHGDAFVATLRKEETRDA